jgi:hypothetical protein
LHFDIARLLKMRNYFVAVYREACGLALCILVVVAADLDQVSVGIAEID